MTATIDASETTLAELLQKVQAGDTVIITSGEEKKPVAKMEAVAGERPKSGPPNYKRLGALEHLKLKVPDSFFDPLPDEWAGTLDGPDDPLNWSAERIAAVNREADRKWQEELKAQAGHTGDQSAA